MITVIHVFYKKTHFLPKSQLPKTSLTSYVQNLRNFVTFKELYEKPAVLKIASQAFEAGDFIHIFKRF